jgi:8-oxo-dGTP pyrophosphatase MutT (NUDIX family)
VTPDPSEPLDSAASAARRATEDDHVFLIPRAALPPGFAETVESGVFTPVAARPAATVVLMRDAEGGPEALLLRRHRRSGFAAGAWVFPGGVVDDADRDPALAERLEGPTAGEWAARMQVADSGEALGYVAAALREAFEETGILLARPDGVGDAAPGGGDAVEVARRALLDGVVGLREVALNLGVRLSGGELLYIAHWITPEPEPRRYDTRFFLAHAPEGAVCTPHEAEMTDARWMRPADAVAAFRRGEIKLLPPTVHTLRCLSRCGSFAEARRALAEAPVPAILPRMLAHPEGVAIVVPDAV